MLARFKERRRAFRQAMKVAKQEAQEYIRVLETDDIWLQLDRLHPAWHPWAARAACMDVLMKHRVLLRSLYIKYAMKGLRNPEKAYLISKPQMERLIHECEFETVPDVQARLNAIWISDLLFSHNALHAGNGQGRASDHDPGT
jgi:hypothetical protein